MSNAFSDFGSVGRKRKKKIKLEKESGAWRPCTSAKYPWSLETTRCGYKVNMAAMEEGKIDVVVKIKREQAGKKDEPPKLHTDLPTSMTFQQLLEQIVPGISHITAICRVGFKKRGEQIPTDFVEVELNDFPC